MTPTHEPSKRPLSDAEFDALDYVVISDARKIQADARYHRARVRELERERDHLRGMVQECESALLECKHEDGDNERLRAALERISEGHAENYSRQQEIARDALSGTEGGAPE